MAPTSLEQSSSLSISSSWASGSSSSPYSVITSCFFRINNFTKDWEELFEPVAGTDKYRRDFSFYIYEKTLEAHKRHINVLGSIGFAINLVSALSAVLGLVGVYKKIPVLVHIWAYGLALYLGWWTFWVSRINLLEKKLHYHHQAVIEPSVLATDFTIPHWAVTIATISAVLFILACTFFVYALTVLASQICEENEQKLVKSRGN